MPVQLTLTNLPAALHERLRASAAQHQRTLEDEAIACLARALHHMPTLADEARLQRVRDLRSTLTTPDFPAAEIDALKRDGRA